MREYEVLAFVQENSGSTDPIKDATELVSGLLKQEGAVPLKVESRGRQFMGFRIRKQREGQLVVSHCKLEPSVVTKLVRSFRLAPGILSSMITIKEAEVLQEKTLEARPVKKPFRGRPTEFKGRAPHASKP